MQSRNGRRLPDFLRLFASSQALSHVSPSARSLLGLAINYVFLVLLILAVGSIDYVTGSELHVVSLYFVPLAFAGMRLGRWGAGWASLIATVVWLVALIRTGGSGTEPYVWVLNFFTQGAAFLMVSLLVARQAELLREEKWLSRTDRMTGLKNRQAFMEQASVALATCKRHGRPISLAYIDLDNFKNVNDSMGHAHGDELLRQFANVIGDSLRSGDIAARMGGDEFAIFLPETGKESARVLLERVCGALQTMPRFHSASVTASIGIVVDGTAQTDMDSLLKQADSQMYDVKRSRKNHVRMCQMEHGVVLPCEFPWPQPPDVEKQDSCVADRVPFESQE